MGGSCASATANPQASGAGVGDAGPFGDFDEEKGCPTLEELRAILGRVPGQRYEISEKKLRNGRPVGYVSGLFRLNLPWPDEGALRLSFWDADPLELHLWNGRSGVTLRYQRKWHHTWSAFGTTREGDKPRPAETALWATDEGRYRRVGVGTVELHWRGGNLTLARGDLPLLTVPMDGPPREVFLELTGRVRGLAVVPSAISPEPPRAYPVVLRVVKPAELEWKGELPEGVVLNRFEDGRVELQAKERTPEAQSGVEVCDPGLLEFTFEVEDAQPGTGVYLADADGNQLGRVGFFRDRETGRLTFGLSPTYQRDIDRSHDRRRLVPWAGQRQWLRVVVGAGVIKLWTSGDGIHWSLAAPGCQALERACRRVGLYCLAHDKPRAIKLCSLEVRRLDALESLVPYTVRKQVELLFESESEAFVKAKNLEEWDRRVAELRTPDAGVDEWRRACALSTLAGNPPLALAQPLLDRLLEAGLAETYRLEEGLRILDEAGLVYNSSDWNAVDRFVAHYERLGRRLARRGDADLFSATSRALVRSAFWTERGHTAFSAWLLRHELLTRIAERRWTEVADLCRRLAHWGRVQQDRPPFDEHVRHLAEWAAAQADEYVPRHGRDKPAGVPLRWRHPLSVRLSREGFNVLAEFEAALKDEAYREACQVISASVGKEGLGLIPSNEDACLWTSLPLAIELAMRQHPLLRDAMRQDFGPMGALRVKQAIIAGDATAVELAALQFHGTDAAADAHLWLGDRDLSRGRLAEAREHYREALASASEEQQDRVRARLRLAGALAGRDAGAPVTSTVQIGSRRLSARQFEQLVAQASKGNPPPPADAPTDVGLLPGQYDLRPWARLEGRRVKRPGAMPDKGFDWAGRQIAVLTTDRLMLVNNQIDQTAFNLSNGRLVWSHRRVVDERFQQWPLVRMRPMLLGGRVFARRLSDDGPELIALDGATGRLLWSSRPGGHVASDPLALGERLMALCASYEAGSTITLSLAEFDFDSGRVRRDVPIAQFNDLWEKRIPCQAAVAEGRIVASVGGCVLSCDASGRVSWMRRQIWVRPPGSSFHQAAPWLEQVHDPPLVDGDRIYVAQPGAWVVECLEFRTGRVVWRRAVSDLTRLVGLASRCLVLQTREGLLAVESESGRPLWYDAPKAEAEGRFVGARPSGQPGLIVAGCLERLKDESGERYRLVLDWIEAETGHRRGQSTLDTPSPADPWLGPWAAHGKRQWALLATAEDPASREILELLPVAEESY
jgi:outer membrane protein assembly factor BamB